MCRGNSHAIAISPKGMRSSETRNTPTLHDEWNAMGTPKSELIVEN